MAPFHLLYIVILTICITPFVTPLPRELGPFCMIDWTILQAQEKIVFDLSCNITTGWFGFGLSRNGAMQGSDIVTIRLLHNGTTLLQVMLN